MNTCSPVEDLAAFLDGTLPPEERDRLAAHIAQCDACYSVFAEAADFQRGSENAARSGSGSVLPFPFRERRAIRWWTAAAALVLLAGGVGFVRLFVARPRITTAELTAALQGDGIEQHAYPIARDRGDAEAREGFSPRPAFMVGVLLVDLWLDARAENVGRTADTLQAIGIQLEDALVMDELQDRYLQRSQQVKSDVEVRRISSELPAMERELESDETSTLSPEYLAFGKWAEAGRLAAAAGARRFFDRGENRRFLAWILRFEEQHPAEGSEEIAGTLREIQRIWAGKDLRPDDYRALEESFRRIIQYYDAAS